MGNQEKVKKHGKKPNVRYKSGSAKNVNTTSKPVRHAGNNITRFQSLPLNHGGRAMSLDRMPTSSGPAVTSVPSGSRSNIKTRSQGDSPFLSANRYDVLSDNDSGDDVLIEPERKSPRIRLPPIHIVGRSVAEVVELLEANGVPLSDDYLLKYTRSSVQFRTKTKEVFDKTVAVLKSGDVQFFTYNTSENVQSKFVLSGLPVVDTVKLKAELEALKITPTEIKVLSKVKSGADDYCLYLLYFKRGSVKIQDLRKVRAVFNVVVSWRYFTKRANDAAQCHRCQRFGHGSEGCHLPPKCVKCGKGHLTDVCPLPRKAELSSNNNSKSQLKCANCGASHTANYRECPARKAYLEEAEKRKKKKTPPSRPAPNRTIQPIASSFPGLPGAVSAEATRPGFSGQRSYAQVASRIEPPASNNNSSDDGLFTVSEFLSLARDMFSRLVNCRTKQQQFDALAELITTYLYNG